MPERPTRSLNSISTFPLESSTPYVVRVSVRRCAATGLTRLDSFFSDPLAPLPLPLPLAPAPVPKAGTCSCGVVLPNCTILGPRRPPQKARKNEAATTKGR